MTVLASPGAPALAFFDKKEYNSLINFMENTVILTLRSSYHGDAFT